MCQLIVRFVRDDKGQDLIEYGLLAGFISLVAMAAIRSVGEGINGAYKNINAGVASIPGAS